MTPALDTDAVCRWADGRIPGFTGPATAEPFATGQSNPTYRLDTPFGSYVLRRKPPGALLKSAHAVEREYAVQQALAETDVPVPRMLALCEDPEVLGTPFYIMEHVAGRSFEDPGLPDLIREERTALFVEMNRVLAAIHDVPIDAVGLGEYGPRGDYFSRQIQRWTQQYRVSETETLTEMDDLIHWLGANQPPEDGQICLVHGDFRLDNLLFAPDGSVCRAVLDWELSTLGHPFADLASVIMQWSRRPGPVGRGLAGLDRGTLGLPSDRAFIDAYCARRGLPGIQDFRFYLAFAFFRMAAILQGVKRRALDGNAANPAGAMALGAQVPDFARDGLAAAQGH